jgi:catechol 2,3-dioxygenase-like lactoylglutathione lyase family enzyme
MKLEKVAFTVYPTADAQRARAFYQGVLGLTLGSHSKDGVWTEYDLPGGGCFALFQDATGQHMKPASGGGTVAFEVDDLDATVAHLRANQVEIKADIFHSPVCRQAVALDPDGNALIFHQLKKK